MKIALTGGTGFIGSHFLKQALDARHNVTAIRRSPSSRSRISIATTPFWLNRQLDEVSADELSGCDVLVHLAAHTGNVPYDILSNCLHWNLTAVLALFEQARLAGIRRFIVAGSCFEYGLSGERYDEIPSDASLKPTNSYAASKAAASIALRQWADEHQLSLEILRIFHVYGEGESDTRFWPSLRRAALAGDDFPMTKGEQVRDFQPVEAVASTFLKRATLQSFPTCSGIYNLGTGKPMSIRQFAQTLWTLWKATGHLGFGQIPYRNQEVMRYVPKVDINISA